MPAMATVTQVPAISGASWMPAAGTEYDINPTGNLSLESMGLTTGAATVSGTGLGIDGPGWVLAYYNGQWLVHNGGLGPQSTYATFALTPPTTGTTATTATTPATGLQLTNGTLIMAGIGIAIFLAVVIFLVYRRKGSNGGTRERSNYY